MTEGLRVTALFPDEGTCVRGVEAVRRAGVELTGVFSPFPCEALHHALGQRRSPVRLWVLLGGLTGCLSGFWLTIGLSLAYPHVTGGMPIVSIPPFVIIAFELTILFGALSGLTGFLVHARVPRLDPEPDYDPRFSEDRFGLIVRCHPAHGALLEAALREAGATEVRHDRA
jgi:molybdopterin-containing oxidoreductase family membrane subunit